MVVRNRLALLYLVFEACGAEVWIEVTAEHLVGHHSHQSHDLSDLEVSRVHSLFSLVVQWSVEHVAVDEEREERLLDSAVGKGLFC